MAESDGNPLHWLWNRGQRWIFDNSTQYVLATIPSDHTDSKADTTPLAAYASYFRVWLSDMFLSSRVAWGTEWIPAVHSEVKLKFGGHDEVTLSRVAQPPPKAGRSVLRNYRLTELMPYSGGVVDMQASLIKMKGESYLGTAIGVLQSFSSLVASPVGQALALAEKVTTGARELVDASNGAVVLALHQSFVSADPSGSVAPQGNVMRPGYHAVVLAPASRIHPELLSVVADQLHYAEADGQVPRPLEGFDYMLFRIESMPQRDDWRLKDIDEPMQQAIVASSQGRDEDAELYRKVALAAVWQSADLAPLDRRRVAEAIKDEWARFKKLGRGATGTRMRSLDAVMKARAIPLSRARALGELTAAEILGA